MPSAVLDRADFPGLLDALFELGYRVVGPTLGEGAIVYDDISSVDDLPAGWGDEQEAGRYRLRRRDDAALFGFVVGPHSWKKYLFPSRLALWESARAGDSLEFREVEHEHRPTAFLGMRACELAAAAIQDKVFTGSGFVDPYYASEREGALFVGVNCSIAGGTCFCVSMETGPECTTGYDLVMTEIIDGDRHDFLIESGSEAGAAVLARLDGRSVTDADREAKAAIVQATAGQMGRSLDTHQLPEFLLANPTHPRWDDVADRCLSCTNCTLVCPTCFCSTVDDMSDLDGTVTRERRWDSCLTDEFSNLHGSPVRSSVKSRYRQWMTHKLATWHDQFGSSGCVGCGRCLTWCPVGIDITAEVAAMRGAE